MINENVTDIPEETLIEKLGEIARSTIEAYQRSPVLRMLVAMNPALAVAEAGILSTYAYFQHQRLRAFADEFTTLGPTISEGDARRREFFDAYTSTAQHVLTESRDAKIRLFARLFGEFVAHGCVTPIDRYEEYLLMLDEISEREFELMLILHRHEAKHPQELDRNALQHANAFWGDFTSDAQAKLGVDEGYLQAMLGRLSRTGLYQEFIGAYLDYTGGRGRFTPLFTEFLSALGISAGSGGSDVPLSKEP